jgi:hypothetical protein
MLSSDSNIYENLLCIRFYSLHLVLNYIIIPTVQMRKPRFGQSLVQTYKVSSRDLGNHFLNYTSETFWGSKVQALSWTNGSWVLTVMAGCKGSPQEERAGRVWVSTGVAPAEFGGFSVCCVSLTGEGLTSRTWGSEWQKEWVRWIANFLLGRETNCISGHHTLKSYQRDRRAGEEALQDGSEMMILLWHRVLLDSLTE